MVGLDGDRIDRIRRDAEPDNPELGWGAALKAAAEVREEAEDAARRLELQSSSSTRSSDSTRRTR